MSRYVNVVIPPLPLPYTYATTKNREIAVGDEVLVPLGNRTAKGFVVNDQSEFSEENSSVKIKEILPSSQQLKSFHPTQLTFFEWIANYYQVPLSQVIEVAVPPRSKDKMLETVELLSEENPPRGKAQKNLLDFLSRNGPTPTTILSRHIKGVSRIVASLIESGHVAVIKSRSSTFENFDAPEWAKTAVTLSSSQEAAYNQILGPLTTQSHKSFLLMGATGSGKTEVYIEAIRYCLSIGKGALIIAPEIALTPQLVDRFRARLGSSIAVLHSALHRRTRWDSWHALLSGEASVAIGARSGIFAPVQNLGLIIVDEEHDGSYKQNDGLRYNARDLAIVRGKLSSCPVVLGSATPSLESLNNARNNKYHFLSLDKGGNKSARNKIEVVDLNKIKPYEMPSRSISPRLCEAIQKVLEKKEQAFILYNRRGFASYLQCEECEHVITCPNCSVTLTYHQNTHGLVCHYCNGAQPRPSMCPVCSADGKTSKVAERGSGTEKVYEELMGLFPDASIARLDRDSVQKLKDYEAVLSDIRSGKADIVVGTQMIAKGHDLPNVTLAAVIDCDIGIHMPDFRSSERVYQLLTQLAGRAGRGTKEGTVLLQTRVPHHASIVFTSEQNFMGFAEEMLKERKSLGYPPFGRLLRIIFSSPEEKEAEDTAVQTSSIAAIIRDRDSYDVSILGPAPAPIARIKNEWRWHMLLKSEKSGEILKLFYLLQRSINRRKKIKVIFDLDPQEML